MQAFGEAAARHHATGEFVDDDDIAVAYDIFLVALEELVRLQGLLDMMYDGYVGCVIQRLFAQQSRLAQQLLNAHVARFSQIYRALLFVDLEMLSRQRRDQLVDGEIKIGFIF